MDNIKRSFKNITIFSDDLWADAKSNAAKEKIPLWRYLENAVKGHAGRKEKQAAAFVNGCAHVANNIVCDQFSDMLWGAIKDLSKRIYIDGNYSEDVAAANDKPKEKL